MEKQRKFNKRYCIAFGCLNNNRKIRDLTLFTLPKDPERRRKWLTLIDREDLAEINDFKYKSYEVCIAHFDEADINTVKHLKANAIPIKGPDSLNTASICINEHKGEDIGYVIKSDISVIDNVTKKIPKLVPSTTQTETKTYLEATTQTTKELSIRNPFERKLTRNVKQIKRKHINKELNQINEELKKQNALVTRHKIPRVP